MCGTGLRHGQSPEVQSPNPKTAALVLARPPPPRNPTHPPLGGEEGDEGGGKVSVSGAWPKLQLENPKPPHGKSGVDGVAPARRGTHTHTHTHTHTSGVDGAAPAHRGQPGGVQVMGRAKVDRLSVSTITMFPYQLLLWPYQGASKGETFSKGLFQTERGGSTSNGCADIRTENVSSQGLDWLMCATFSRRRHKTHLSVSIITMLPYQLLLWPYQLKLWRGAGERASKGGWRDDVRQGPRPDHRSSPGP